MSSFKTTKYLSNKSFDQWFGWSRSKAVGVEEIEITFKEI